MILRRTYHDGSELLPQPISVQTSLHTPASLPLHTPTPQSQEYELLLEYDLKREKEKNMILEERLKNKEVFIQQMKHFQEELTLAYQQCKNQLVLAQQKIDYLQNVEYREYTEQIADLKHMLALKQDSKRNSVGREERFTAKNRAERGDRGGEIGDRGERGGGLSQISHRRESKNSSHYNTHRERSATSGLEQEVAKELKKSANFILHFLQMAECYLPELKSEGKLSKRLKRSWKWVKDVVKEWDQLKEQLKFYEAFKEELSHLLGAEKDVELNRLLSLVDALK